jgi:hypothetical protein
MARLRARKDTPMAKSLWGAWLPKLMADLKKVEPTKAEYRVIQEAERIRLAHKKRIEAMMQQNGLTK